MSKETKVLSKFKPFVLGTCRCPGKESIPVRTKRGLLQTMKHGHTWKIKENNPSKRGAENHNWKGGVIHDQDDYILTYSSDHPNKNGTEYVRTHRLIYENYLSIMMDEEVFIPRKYLIHHINGDKEDNSLINLEFVQNQTSHMKFHPENNKKDMSNRFCLLCGSNTTYITKKTNWPVWYKYENGFLCKKCGDTKRRK